jgi:DNA-binding transcriptional LysR family regulator
MPLWSERVLVLLTHDHPLATRDAIYWTDLRNDVVVLSRRDPGPEFEDLLTAKLISPGDRPRIVQYDAAGASLKSLVGARFGISLVTEASTGVKLDGLVCRELRDGSGPTTKVYVAHWRAGNDNPALENFLKLLGERHPLPITGVGERSGGISHTLDGSG